MKNITTLLILFFALNAFTQNTKLERVEPPNWWAGMKSSELQLMVYGDNISKTDIYIDYPGVDLVSVTKVENPNYLFVDLKLCKNVKPGKFDIEFKTGKKTIDTYAYASLITLV